MTKKELHHGEQRPDVCVTRAHCPRKRPRQRTERAVCVLLRRERNCLRHLSFADFRDHHTRSSAALNDLGYTNNQREGKEDQEEKKKLSIRLKFSGTSNRAHGAVLSGTKVQSSKTEGEFYPRKVSALWCTVRSARKREDGRAHPATMLVPPGLKKVVWEC